MTPPNTSATATPDDALLFASNPAQFFAGSHTLMSHVAPERLARLQLAGLRLRFAELRNRIPVLSTIANAAAIEGIDRLDDVVPLLLPHSMYKSYPAALLERGHFSLMTRWLNGLTTIDLSQVDVESCDSIDAWLDELDRQTDVRVAHSSGTTGTLSFLPRTTAEWDRMIDGVRCSLLSGGSDSSSAADQWRPLHVVWPTFRHGRTGITRAVDLVVKHIAGSESHLHALNAGRMSSDALFLAARLRAAQARGEVAELEVGPAVRAKARELEETRRSLADALPRYVEHLGASIRGERVWLFGTWNILHDLATAGLERGSEHLFSADSIVTSGGGAKGLVQPDEWEEPVKRFTGVAHISYAYGMTELTALNHMCEHGHYHIEPWIIPFVLDPETGAPRPRTGRQTGRAAFFDLLPGTYWGGFITGDEVTADWSLCPCGRTTPHIEAQIERYSDKRDSDDKISCAATDAAHRDALDFLDGRLT